MDGPASRHAPTAAHARIHAARLTQPTEPPRRQEGEPTARTPPANLARRAAPPGGRGTRRPHRPATPGPPSPHQRNTAAARTQAQRARQRRSAVSIPTCLTMRRRRTGRDTADSGVIDGHRTVMPALRSHNHTFTQLAANPPDDMTQHIHRRLAMQLPGIKVEFDLVSAEQVKVNQDPGHRPDAHPDRNLATTGQDIHSTRQANRAATTPVLMPPTHRPNQVKDRLPVIGRRISNYRVQQQAVKLKPLSNLFPPQVRHAAILPRPQHTRTLLYQLDRNREVLARRTPPAQPPHTPPTTRADTVHPRCAGEPCWPTPIGHESLRDHGNRLCRGCGGPPGPAQVHDHGGWL
jgi:hypothetical protein